MNAISTQMDISQSQMPQITTFQKSSDNIEGVAKN
jgi:hypothetical protein